jgi:hypothetical protein
MIFPSKLLLNRTEWKLGMEVLTAETNRARMILSTVNICQNRLMLGVVADPVADAKYRL